VSGADSAVGEMLEGRRRYKENKHCQPGRFRKTPTLPRRLCPREVGGSISVLLYTERAESLRRVATVNKSLLENCTFRKRKKSVANFTPRGGKKRTLSIEKRDSEGDKILVKEPCVNRLKRGGS